MEPIVGIFAGQEQAEDAARRLLAAGIPAGRLNLLTPAISESQVHAAIPTSDTEGEGVAPALGGVVGAVAGGTAGLGLGAAAASLLVPGIGAISAVGLAAAALFGAAGGVGGAAAGHAIEEKASRGIPKDDVYVYEDALRRGHSIVLLIPESDDEMESARRVLEASGAESVDAARDRWWSGIRDGERLHAEQRGDRFEDVEPAYRRGFQAAQHPDARDRGYGNAPRYLRQRHGDVWEAHAFRRGYERGCDWARERASAIVDTPKDV